MKKHPRQVRTRSRTVLGLVAACALLAVSTSRAADKDAAAGDFHRPLKSLASAKSLLGDGWFEATDGLVIENTKDTSDLEPKDRAAGENLARAMLVEKIVAVGDFSYTRKDVPRIVTVRIYVFEDTAAARAFWAKQADLPTFRQHYEKLPKVGDAAFKNLKTTKEMAIKKNVWLVSHQLHEGDDYHRVLLHYVDEIGKEPKAQEKP